MAEAPSILRLSASARSWVLGTALPVESVGSKQTLHGEIRAGLAGGKKPCVGASQAAASGSKPGGGSWTLCQRAMLRCGGYET